MNNNIILKDLVCQALTADFCSIEDIYREIMLNFPVENLTIEAVANELSGLEQLNLVEKSVIYRKKDSIV